MKFGGCYVYICSFVSSRITLTIRRDRKIHSVLHARIKISIGYMEQTENFIPGQAGPERNNWIGHQVRFINIIREK